MEEKIKRRDIGIKFDEGSSYMQYPLEFETNQINNEQKKRGNTASATTSHL